MTVLDRGEGLCHRRSPFVRRQSQGRFPAAPENLMVVNVGELLWEFLALTLLSVLGNTTSAGLFRREE